MILGLFAGVVTNTRFDASRIVAVGGLPLVAISGYLAFLVATRRLLPKEPNLRVVLALVWLGAWTSLPSYFASMDDRAAYSPGTLMHWSILHEAAVTLVSIGVAVVLLVPSHRDPRGTVLIWLFAMLSMLTFLASFGVGRNLPATRAFGELGSGFLRVCAIRGRALRGPRPGRGGDP